MIILTKQDALCCAVLCGDVLQSARGDAAMGTMSAAWLKLGLLWAISWIFSQRVYVALPARKTDDCWLHRTTDLAIGNMGAANYLGPIFLLFGYLFVQ
jgi:hypothetical protein